MVETVTPTGAVLITSLSENYGTVPPMKLISVGYGAGGRDLPVPNLIRILIGEHSEDQKISTEMLMMLETNIDDLNPEIYAYVMEKLFSAGALDVFITPIQMKKNRPGAQLSVICNDEDTSKACQIIFSETTTLGIRQHRIMRHSLIRETFMVDTQYGMMRIKKALLPNGQYKVAPEYEDCRKLAIESGVPLRDIYLAAESAANLDR
jgi:uncharacterized protein (DUF111 family)